MIGTKRLADVFVEVADTLVDDFDLIDFLHRLAARAAEVSGTSAVGLNLTDEHGSLHYMAASTDDARLLELLQLQHEEGPCVECHRTGRPVSHLDLSGSADIWPTFGPAAVAAGFRSVHAFPMRVRDRVIGALNVFSTEATALEVDDRRVVQALADVATIAIIQERAIARADVLTEQLQFALNSRIVIEQAKGAVARTFGISVDAAFERIRLQARTERVRLTDLAHQLVTEPDRMASLSDDG